jgi:hypothetical protein
MGLISTGLAAGVDDWPSLDGLSEEHAVSIAAIATAKKIL